LLLSHFLFIIPPPKKKTFEGEGYGGWKTRSRYEGRYEIIHFDNQCPSFAGRRTNPLLNIPPASRGRKDYGRIA